MHLAPKHCDIWGWGGPKALIGNLLFPRHFRNVIHQVDTLLVFRIFHLLSLLCFLKGCLEGPLSSLLSHFNAPLLGPFYHYNNNSNHNINSTFHLVLYSL